MYSKLPHGSGGHKESRPDRFMPIIIQCGVDTQVSRGSVCSLRNLVDYIITLTLISFHVPLHT